MLSDRNIMPFRKRSPCPLKLYIYARPLPRAAHAAFPSPSCSGKRPKVERWRGVNSLANYGLITLSQTIVIRNFVPPKFRKVKQPGNGKVKQPT